MTSHAKTYTNHTKAVGYPLDALMKALKALEKPLDFFLYPLKALEKAVGFFILPVEGAEKSRWENLSYPLLALIYCSY